MNNSDKPPVIILGGGGHASVLTEICREQGRQIHAVVSPEPHLTRQIFHGLKHLLRDEDVLDFSAEDVELVNGVGGLLGSDFRMTLASKFSELGYCFATIVSPSATISRTAKLEEGVQVLPGATINTGASVGTHSIINTGAVVEHDCKIQGFVQVGPNSTLCGGVSINKGSIIGPGAVIGQGVSIGVNTVIGAGASVVRSIGDRKRILPAKIIAEDR